MDKKTHQHNEVINKKGSLALDRAVYIMALQNRDWQVALNALYYMIARSPNNIAYQDSLTTLYFIMGAYEKSILAGEKVLLNQPDNIKVLEIVALSQKMLGNIKGAVVQYEKLFARTSKIIYAYQVAEMQFNLKRYGECLKTTEFIRDDSLSVKEIIQVTINDTLQQKVSMKAAALNINGMVHKELNKMEDAKASFRESLKLSPAFALAISNLKEIEK